MTTTPAITQALVCDHCGLNCADASIRLDEHVFCCTGCRTVFEILHETGLETFYELQERHGRTLRGSTARPGRFDYLDDDAIRRQLTDYDDGRTAKVTFRLPQIHCASCVWLLENLGRLQPGVGASEVDFLRRELAITFDPRRVSLRALVERLAGIGYEPDITLESGEPKKRRFADPLVRRVGIAGFCFGNAMLFSLPEYFAGAGELSVAWQRLFGALNIMLSVPVLLYSSSPFLVGAWQSLKQRTTTIDVPIALGIVTLYGRSLYEILAGHGPGYMDSFMGLVFFLLLGRLVQRSSFTALSFERDYRSYFPLAATVHEGHTETSVPIASLRPGQRIVARHGELVPADARLVSARGRLDMSFVTGESEPVDLVAGDAVWAGGRVAGGAIELDVEREVSRSYLTRLWNGEEFRHGEETLSLLANRVSRGFTAGVLAIAAATAIYWLAIEPGAALHAMTSVLIVACPCALALSMPFTTGSALNLLARAGLYLRDGVIVERLGRLRHIVFDKTGTLTSTRDNEVRFHAAAGELSPRDLRALGAVLANSVHPLSRKLIDHLFDHWGGATGIADDFHEAPGLGVTGRADGVSLCAGSRRWLQECGCRVPETDDVTGTAVHVAVDGAYRGCFTLDNVYRPQVGRMLQSLRRDYPLSLLSGDNDRERSRLLPLFGDDAPMRFNLSPQGKLDAVRLLEEREPTMMVGDGLNDAGALRASHVGLAVTENVAAFSPACDGILDAAHLDRLPAILRFARACTGIIVASFVLSLLYNTIGLSFAVRGDLSPLLSAILMPLSSISVIAFTVISTRVAARWTGIHR